MSLRNGCWSLYPEGRRAPGRCEAEAGFRQCKRKPKVEVRWNAGLTARLCRQHAGNRIVVKELK